MNRDSSLPTVKDVLLVLGVGTFLAASVVMPGLPLAAKPVMDYYKKKKREEAFRQWERFNQRRLKHLLKRLYQQKVVEIGEVDGQEVVTLTEKGKKKVLIYKLEEMMIDKPPKWDGRWRVIIYDVGKEKRIMSEIFRNFLKKMQFLKLQKSVYLTPYKCDEQIEFLRQYYGLGQEVIYIVAQRVENEEVYKHYFGL